MTEDKEDEDADKVREIIFGEKLYPAMVGLGKFLVEQYRGVDDKKAEQIFKKINKLLGDQETNHVHIVMQQVFDFMGARVVKKERWDKIKAEREKDKIE